MLTQFIKKVKQFGSAYKTDLFTAAVIFLVGMAGFGLGRLSAIWPEKQQIRITNHELGITNKEIKTATTSIIHKTTPPIKGKFVGSKSGTAYHFPWCPGALKIKEENKIWFETKEEAEKKGYKPAGNCPGL